MSSSSRYIALCIGGYEDEVIEHVLYVLRHVNDSPTSAAWKLPMSNLPPNRIAVQHSRVNLNSITGGHSGAPSPSLSSYLYDSDAGCGKIIVETDCAVEVLLSITMVSFWFAYITRSQQITIGCKESLRVEISRLITREDCQQALDCWRRSRQATVTTITSNNSFCVRCIRGGTHEYSSQDVSVSIGDAFSLLYPDWKVDLVKMDCEIIALLMNEVLVVGIRISSRGEGQQKPFLKNRFPAESIVSVGTIFTKDDTKISMSNVSSMRPSSAALMVHLMQLQPGDIVVDGFCGLGRVIEQAAHLKRGATVLGGDVTLPLNQHFAHLTKTLPMAEMAFFAACKLPIRNASIDVYFIDFPWGIRAKPIAKSFRFKIPRLVEELARVLLPVTGRGVVIVQQCQHFISCLDSVYFESISTRGVNIGGLVATVCTFKRSSVPFSPILPGSDTWDRNDEQSLKRLKTSSAINIP